MKANAPEKIYLDEDEFWHLPNPNGNSVEYIQTDVFIKKAQDFFRQSNHLFGLDGDELYHFIEDFRRYMKKE